MKKKFIKFVTAALVCAGLLTVTGCGKKDPFTAYEEAAVKTSELKSIASTAKLNMKLSAQGQSIEIGMDMDMKILNPNGDDMQADIVMDMNMLGQNILMNSYYKDGYYYTASGDSKVKYIMDINEMKEQIAANSVQTGLKKEDFKEISMEKKDKDSLITFTIKGETMSKVVDSAMGALSDMMAGSDMEMKIGDIPGTATVNKDNYISAMTMKMPLTMTVAGQEMTMDLDMDITYTDPGKDVTVEFPDDLDTYEEIDMSAGALGDTAAGEDTFSDNSAEDGNSAEDNEDGTAPSTTEGAADTEDEAQDTSTPDDEAEDSTTKDAA